MANGLFESTAGVFEQRRKDREAALMNILNAAGTREQKAGRGLAVLVNSLFRKDPDAADKAAVADIRQLDAGQAGISPTASTELGGSYSPEVLAQQAAATQGLREGAFGGLSQPIKQAVQSEDIRRRTGMTPEGLLQGAKEKWAENPQLATQMVQVAKALQGQGKTETLTEEEKAAVGIDAKGVFQRDPAGKINQITGTGGDATKTKVYSATDSKGNVRYISAPEGQVPEVLAGEVLNTIGTPKAGTNITLKNEGTIPTDHTAIRDEAGHILRFEVIEGSKTDRDIKAAESKRQGRISSIARAGRTVIQDLGRMEELLVSDPTTSGLPSLVFSTIPTSNAAEVIAFGESALSNVGLDVLQTMRDNSPTGGALGQVPIQQQKRLEQVYGSLNSAQKPQVVIDNVRRLQNIYKDIVYGTPEELEDAYKEGKISEDYLQTYSQRKPLSFDEFGRAIEIVPTSPESRRKTDLEERLKELKGKTFD